MPHCKRKRRPIATGTGVPLVTYVAILSRDYSMLKTKKVAPGATRSLPAIALIAATFLAGGLTEAAAKSRKHHHHHVAKSAEKSVNKSDWKEANAAMTPSAGTGRSFAGVASFYGNE